jgi:hypothetical protein
MKNEYFEKINLPKIPNELISSIVEIETFRNFFPNKAFSHTYASYEVPDRLCTFLRRYFEHDICVRYQVIKNKLPVHIDKGTTEKINYIIDPGGKEVKTRWWDNLSNPKHIVCESILEKNEWYYLNVSLPHDITEIVSPRISITIKNDNLTQK